MHRQNRPNVVGDQPSDTTNAQPSAPDDGESFDFDVSGGSDSEKDGQPVHQARRPRNATVTEVDQIINDQTPVQDSKKGAADIRYFFERQDDKHVCKVCKYVNFLYS
jgi:hypothetical protein